MRCPTCNAHSSVLETRGLTRRRRECFNGHRFFTTEVVEGSTNTQTPMTSTPQPTIPSSLSPGQIDAVCEGHGHRPYLRASVATAGMAALGMHRWPEGSQARAGYAVAWDALEVSLRMEFGAEAQDMIDSIQAAVGSCVRGRCALGGGHEFK